MGNPVGAVPDGQIRVGGDIRAQENNALECMHTILVREHNRCAIQLADDNSDRTSDEIFEECRWFNMAYVQNILYAEYAPLLLPEVGMAGVPGRLGHNLDAVYQGYNSSASPNVFNEFSGALFRYGHSELQLKSPELTSPTETLLNPSIWLMLSLTLPKLLPLNPLIKSLLVSGKINKTKLMFSLLKISETNFSKTLLMEVLQLI